MIRPDHPAVEALARRYAAEMDWSMSADGLPGRDLIIQDARAFLTAALPDLTAATPENLARLRDTPVGRALMAEAWDKFQEHYAAEWDEAYPDDIFPTPAPPPAVVSRESVAASMMRHWAERLRADRNPYLEADQ